jgi:regulation of enolase protein 1 (concanavalin A-like superfamily)
MPEKSMVPWDAGTWTTEPAHVSSAASGHLDVTAAEGSDAWRHTAYGFVHDNAHALLAPFAVGDAMEVSFRAPWDGQFDQAGVFVLVDEEHWVKAGIEYSDDHLGLGAVVTDIRSDWSVGHVDDWHDSEITVRVSRWHDAVIVRARADDQPWRLVRVAPFDGDAPATAGPFLAAPTRAGLTVRFTRWQRSAADARLH